jgi:hypothetical protein
MKLEIKNPGQLLNKAYAQQSPGSEALELFRTNLAILLECLQGGESEEHQKNHIRDFLKDTWYQKSNRINTSERIDLAIYAGMAASDPVAVIIEAKSSSNSAEMMTCSKPNAKAIHELILYYLREVFENKNYEIKHLIVTNTYEWFIFDGVWFERNVRRNPALVKAYKGFKPDGHDNRHFYESIAKPWLETLEEPIPCCWFDLRTTPQTTPQPPPYKEVGGALSSPPILGGAGGGKVLGGKVLGDLISLYKFLSPQHLLKQSVSNDSNSLNREFYGELLHIVGLEEVKEKGKKLIRRTASERRNEGSLLENTINLLRVQQSLDGMRNRNDFGADEDEQYFSIALELCITWLNRILFLKLLEGRLIAWNPGDVNYAFLNSARIKDFDELQELFFEVLARQECDRTSDVTAKFGAIPYLNSSLFEMTSLERTAVQISNLKQRLAIPLYAATVLKNDAGKRRSGDSNTLYYLFEFLDAYDFSSEGKALVKETPKTIINASVLGLIFEKINGYRDGSFYTPGYITMYMSREAIRRAVVEKFSSKWGEINGWDDLCDKLDYSKREIREAANAIVNSLKICDPAVGSGHFLVSALNEIIAIKAELNILEHQDGNRLKGLTIDVENDELIVTLEEEPFSYNIKNLESQRVQETLFREKAIIIENCLFGVDINPKSVAICRLRLWVELLKNAYYTTPITPQTTPQTTPQPPPYKEGGGALSSPPVLGGAGGGKVLSSPPISGGAGGDKVLPLGGKVQKVLETLPNIDINIKCGNSLVSRFTLDDNTIGLTYYAPVERRRLKDLTKRYKEKVWMYKLGEKGPSNKGILRREIEAIKEEWRTFSLPSDFYMKNLLNVKNELTQAVFAFDEVGHKKREKLHEQAAELEKKIAGRQETVYANAFEWRFEFPEVLDEEGRFEGFDVVIGNPPYGVKFKKEELYQHLERYSAADKVPDSYCFFMLLSFDLLRQAGILSFVVPNTFCDLESGETFRKTLLQGYQMSWIWQTGWAFETAVVDTLVFQAINEKPAPDATIAIISEDQKYTRLVADFLSNRLTKIDYRNQPGKSDLIGKITKRSVLLGDIADVKAGVKMYERGKGKPPQTEEIVTERPYSIIGDCPEGWKSLYRGTEVTRFALKPAREFVNYGPWLAAPRSAEMFDSPKLLMRRTDDRLMCAIEHESEICVNSCHVIKHKVDAVPHFSYEFLMAILNSRLTQYYFELSNPQMQGKVFAEIKVVYVQNLPIPNATPEQQTPIIELVDQILAAKKADPKADTSGLEVCIDDLVYGLYGLDNDEKEIVAGGGNLTTQDQNPSPSHQK